MAQPALTNLTRSETLAERLGVARTFRARLVGLIGRASLAPAEGLLFPGERSLHMMFMRFPIDALFLGPELADGTRRVVRRELALQPWRGLVLPVSGADVMIELPDGALTASGTEVGDRVRIELPTKPTKPTVAPTVSPVEPGLIAPPKRWLD